ncbi:precorrin-6y C5,15-methyltransferase (decarboxylating) subunit CbiE [Microbaculum marinum]|uniref:Precorrin-6y C5,15-methyltransferase (Decarboxylating) subunit CbiE n=1 Tax=Microbaculum marinum TaxID=1764581 RepID=A0AAW9RXT6_9HYPH
MSAAAQARSPWLSIIGIGEDGIEGLTGAARALLSGARVVYGGKRHLALADGLISGEARAWPSPLTGAVDEILGLAGTPVAVLASGDPYLYGVGSLLARHVPAAQITAIPAPSAFSLACARLGWAVADCAQVTCCGRPVETLAPHLQPGRRVLVLSADETTPAAVATYLSARGFGASRLHVMEALGGRRERIREAEAYGFGFNDVDPLNLIGIEVVGAAGAKVIPLASGLPDAFFENDGQLTKREIRAVTLSSLAPRAGERLWDIGCGSGSISIEWLLRHPANRAIAIERDPERAARAARNAANLGVPRLEIVEKAAPEAFADLPAPDAVFIGGGGQADGVIETAWSALRPGGRMVVNAVTLETEARLIAAHGTYGGSLARLSVERLEAIGGRHGFRPAMTVTQWVGQKPRDGGA